jgi:hypothetical protein
MHPNLATIFVFFVSFVIFVLAVGACSVTANTAAVNPTDLRDHSFRILPRRGPVMHVVVSAISVIIVYKAGGRIPRS